MIFKFKSKLITKLSSKALGYILFVTTSSYSIIKPWIPPSLSLNNFTEEINSLFLQAFGVENVNVFSWGFPTKDFSFLRIDLKSFSKNVFTSGISLGSLFLYRRYELTNLL